MSSYFQVTFKDGVPISCTNLAQPPKTRSNKLAQLIFPAAVIAQVEVMDDPFSVCSGKTTAEAMAKIVEAMRSPNKEISLKLPGTAGHLMSRQFTGAVKGLIEKLEYQFFTFNEARQTIKFDI